MKTPRTPAAARKIGITALKCYAIGLVLAAWWVWAMSIPTFSKLFDEVHGTTFAQKVSHVRGFSEAQAQQPETSASAPYRMNLLELGGLSENKNTPSGPALPNNPLPSAGGTADQAKDAASLKIKKLEEDLNASLAQRSAEWANLPYPPTPEEVALGSWWAQYKPYVFSKDAAHYERLAEVIGAALPVTTIMSMHYRDAAYVVSRKPAYPKSVVPAPLEFESKRIWEKYSEDWRTHSQSGGAKPYALELAEYGRQMSMWWGTIESMYRDHKKGRSVIASEAEKYLQTNLRTTLFYDPESIEAMIVAWREVEAGGPVRITPLVQEFLDFKARRPAETAAAIDTAAPTVQAASPVDVHTGSDTDTGFKRTLENWLALVGTVDGVRFYALSFAFVTGSLWVLMGGRFAAIRKPRFIPQPVVSWGAPVGFAIYAFTFWVSPGQMQPTLWPMTISFVPPVIFLVGPIYWHVKWEWGKETRIYRRWLLRGRGLEVARMGGVGAYLKRDITRYTDHNHTAIQRTKFSPLYIGATLSPLDYKLGGRDIGIISEQHFLTVAGSGAGKSRDALYNNLGQYCGGVVAYDTKGELSRFAYERRRAFAPVAVIAPFDGMNNSPPLGLPLSYWNPLESIEPNDPAARDLIARMGDALIVPDGQDTGNSAHFREMAQLILRGYIAHVVTKYPPGERHLGTVYDLFKRGAPNETTFDPEKVAQVVIDMADNPACGSTAADAAGAFMSLEEKEKSGVISTITRAVDWMGSPVLKTYFGKPTNVDLRKCKTQDASVFLVIPEMHRASMRGFLRLFYQVAFDVMDETRTPQPEGSERRVLFIFDEFYSLGAFKAAVDAANMKRSSYIKCWFVLQNIGQLTALYTNPRDFLSNCDKQIFGMDRTDGETIDLIRKGLGSYSDDRGDTMEIKSVMSDGEITEALDGDSGEQIFIPMKGAPMLLRRVPYHHRITPFPLRIVRQVREAFGGGL